MNVSPSAALRLGLYATCGAALVVALAYDPRLYAPFVVPKFAALELTAALGLVSFALHRGATRRPRWSAPVALGVGLVALTTALAWLVATRRPEGAPYAPAALARLASLFGLACGASVLREDRGAAQRALEAVTVASAAVSALGLWQHFELPALPIPVISTPGSTFGNRNVAAETVAMSLPFAIAALVTAQRRGARAAHLGALGVSLLYLAVTRARGAWLASMVGLALALLLTKARWSRAARLVALGAVAIVLVVAALPARTNPRHLGDTKRFRTILQLVVESFDSRTSALRTRRGFFRRTISMAREHPTVGVGPGNWPVFFPRYAEPGASRDGVLSPTLAPRQAHNDLLQRWAETGSLGLVALLVLIAAVARAARRRLRTDDDLERPVTAAAASSLGAFLALGLPGFPFEMPGTLALAGIALGLVAHEREPTGAPPALDRAALALGLALLPVVVVRAERSHRASAALFIAERTLVRDRSAAGAVGALRALDRSLAANESQRAHLRRSQMLLRLQRAPEALIAAQQARAWEPYSPNAWTALAAASLSAGDFAGARRDATRALELLHDQAFVLHLRANAAERMGDHVAAAADRAQIEHEIARRPAP